MKNVNLFAAVAAWLTLTSLCLLAVQANEVCEGDECLLRILDSVNDDAVAAGIVRDMTVSKSSVLTNKANLEQAVIVAIARSWWLTGSAIIQFANDNSIDVTSVVRTNVLNLKRHADELVRKLDHKHAQVSVISPALQWTQTEDMLYILTKFSARWSSPGALAVHKENVTVTPCCLNLSAHGQHSHATKLFVLDLEFFEDVDPESLDWSFTSVGKISLTIRKVKQSMWPRLVKDEKRKTNMHIWLDMQESLAVKREERKKQEDDEEFQRKKDADPNSKYWEKPSDEEQTKGKDDVEAKKKDDVEAKKKDDVEAKKKDDVEAKKKDDVEAKKKDEL